jgi:hypothetical protein
VYRFVTAVTDSSLNGCRENHAIDYASTPTRVDSRMQDVVLHAMGEERYGGVSGRTLVTLCLSDRPYHKSSVT